MRRIILGLVIIPLSLQAQTLEECQRAAERNYPLIRQYDLIAKTTDLTVRNIGKSWLPQVSASAQVTYQSDVAAWYEQMGSMLKSMGVDLKGLRKDQYRVGVDVQQTIYDGGTVSSQKEIARQQGLVEAAQNEVSMYQIRQRVNEPVFRTVADRRPVAGSIWICRKCSAVVRRNSHQCISMVPRQRATIFP